MSYTKRLIDELHDLHAFEQGMEVERAVRILREWEQHPANPKNQKKDKPCK